MTFEEVLTQVRELRRLVEEQVLSLSGTRRGASYLPGPILRSREMK